MISLRTLGPVDVAVDGGPPPPELLWRKHLALLIYLARSPRRTRTRDHLVGLLWSERPEAAARHSLREAIRVLRRAAGEDGVDATGEQLRLADTAVALDADSFEALAAGGRWEEAAELVTGDFLEGFAVPGAPEYEDWLAAERVRLRGLAVEALARSAAEATRRGCLSDAADRARRALRLDPASGAAARAVITALALMGERAAAISCFDSHSARLAAELSADPDPETRALAERVRSERTWRLPAPDPASAQEAISRRAPLAGRERDLAALLEVWGSCRRDRRATAAFLEGDSGVGKTRLAEELLARARLDGATVAGVRGVPSDRAEPWAGVMALARSGLADAPGVAGASPSALAAFAARLPEWADRYPGARGAKPLSPSAALADVVRAAADERAVVLLLDDAHWLDDASLATCAALLRDLAAAPLLLLFTGLAATPRGELDALRTRIGRDVPGVALRLGALPGPALRTLARWAFPRYSDVEVDRLARRVATDSAGLPLLAVELIHAVALGLDLHGVAGAWPAENRTLDDSLPADLPDAVVAALRINYRRLSRDAQAALAAVSVLGDSTDASRLARATGLERERLDAALDELEWQRWLVSDARGYGVVARMVRDVVAREMLTPGQRRRMLDAASGEPTADGR